MIQMETSLFEARCCLRTPLKGPSPGINHWPRPRAGKAEVAPRLEVSGRVRHPSTVPQWSRQELSPLPCSHSLGTVFECLLMALPGHLRPTL